MEKMQKDFLNVDCSEKMSLRQVATFFNVHTNTVRRWVNAGKIPAFKLPSGVISYIPAEAIRQYQQGAYQRPHPLAERNEGEGLCNG